MVERLYRMALKSIVKYCNNEDGKFDPVRAAEIAQGALSLAEAKRAAERAQLNLYVVQQRLRVTNQYDPDLTADDQEEEPQQLGPSSRHKAALVAALTLHVLAAMGLGGVVRHSLGADYDISTSDAVTSWSSTS